MSEEHESRQVETWRGDEQRRVWAGLPGLGKGLRPCPSCVPSLPVPPLLGGSYVNAGERSVHCGERWLERVQKKKKKKKTRLKI